jgi:hypothetical protein
MAKVGKAEDKKIAGGVTRKEVSEEKLNIAFSGPAVAANQVFATIGSGGVRMAFVEQQGASLPIFRTAAMIPISQAISLKDVLADLLKDVEKQMAGAKKQDG